jgi:hypothetical protein
MQTRGDAVPEDLRNILSFARALWTMASNAFGRPGELLRRGFVSRRHHRALADWVLHLENLVRRIVLVLALDVLEKTWPQPAAIRQACPKPVTTHAQRPRSFQVLAGLTIRTRSARKRHAPDPRSPDAIPVRAAGLARRLEALRHAIYHTDEHARRIARFIERRLMKPSGPTPKVSLRRWRAPSWRQTLASKTVAELILKIEPLLPGFLEEPG